MERVPARRCSGWEIVVLASCTLANGGGCGGKEDGMANLTHDQVVQIVGSLEDDRIAEIIATGATAEQLAQAFAWVSGDDHVLRLQLSGVVAELVDILEANEPGWDER